MKYIFRIMMCIALLGATISCSDDKETPAQTVTITPADLDGTWTLTSSGETPLAEGLYVYITFSRKERTFEMYDNFSSMYSRHTSGTFNLYDDEDLGSILTGEYDYEQGSWQEYVVTAFDGTTLTLALRNNPSDTTTYTRCEGVPADIVSGIRSLIR